MYHLCVHRHVALNMHYKLSGFLYVMLLYTLLLKLLWFKLYESNRYSIGIIHISNIVCISLVYVP